MYVWHCDREGRYSMYSEGVEDQNYLRGAQIADNDGIVRFTSIFPACYSGRWPHIHFEVYPDRESITDSTNAIATSQVALPKAVCDKVYATTGYEQSVTNLSGMSLSSDNVFGDDGGASQLATATGNVDAGYTVKLAVRIDTSTKPSGGVSRRRCRPGRPEAGDGPGASTRHGGRAAPERAVAPADLTQRATRSPRQPRRPGTMIGQPARRGGVLGSCRLPGRTTPRPQRS